MSGPIAAVGGQDTLGLSKVWEEGEEAWFGSAVGNEQDDTCSESL